jgi:hypothetical protein
MKLGITWCYLLFMLINHNRNSYYASAKSVDIATQHNCHEHVGDFFKSFLNISIVPSEKIGKLSNYQLIILFLPLVARLVCHHDNNTLTKNVTFFLKVYGKETLS